MAGSIPPLVSSSPPPLCPFDDEEEEEEDEYGIYTATEDIDYNECITFKETNGVKRSKEKTGREQDSTSQDSATDSGLCPDSEGVSPTPHSDEERISQLKCDINVDVTHTEDRSTNLPNGHLGLFNDLPPTEAEDDFGHFEFAPTSSVEVNAQDVKARHCNEAKEADGIKVKLTEDSLEHTTVSGEFEDGKTSVENKSHEIVCDNGNQSIDLNCQTHEITVFPIYQSAEMLEEHGSLIQEEIIDIIQSEQNKFNSEESVKSELEIGNSDKMDDNFDDFTDFTSGLENNTSLNDGIINQQHIILSNDLTEVGEHGTLTGNNTINCNPSSVRTVDVEFENHCSTEPDLKSEKVNSSSSLKKNSPDHSHENDMEEKENFHAISEQITTENDDMTEQNDDDFDEFSNFKTNLEESTQSEVGLQIKLDSAKEEDEFDDFTDFKSNFCDEPNFPIVEQSDISSENHLSAKPPTEPQLVLSHEHNDEFSNFADFSSLSCGSTSIKHNDSVESVCHIPVSSSEDHGLRTESEFQDWVSVFPAPPSSDSSTDEELSLLQKNDPIWSRLFPLESSPALSYQWTDSLANRQLLTALNIDSRNILWSNCAVPRFAANLSCSPLQPVKAPTPIEPTGAAPQVIATQRTPSATPHPQSLESVPDAHFDWVGSGLTNPLDGPKSVLNLQKTLSVEAENILSSLPDLSFMRKTYIDFPINEG